MKHKCLLLALVAVTCLAGCDAVSTEEGMYSGTVILSGSHMLERGTQLRGGLIIFGGEVTVDENAAIAGSVEIVDGNMTLGGRVNGDVSIIGGNLIVSPDAVIGRDLNIGGGSVRRSPEATIGGQITTGMQLPTVRSWWGAQSVAGALLQSLLRAVIVAVAAFVATRLMPVPVGRVAEAAARHPFVSGAMGILVIVVGLAALVMIAFTIILIPVAVLGILVGLLAIAYGWIAMGSAVGRWLARHLTRELSPPSLAALGTFVFLLALDALGSIPLVGDTVAMLLTAAAFGAVILTRFGIRPFVPATYPAADLAP